MSDAKIEEDGNIFIKLAVNGTLMRGLKLEKNMLAARATFLREAKTEPCYRLWTICDEHPAMQRVKEGGVSIDLEIWKVPVETLYSILLNEPPGLCIGKATLSDGEEVLGVVGEAILCEEKGEEITKFCGWHNYMESKK